MNEASSITFRQTPEQFVQAAEEAVRKGALQRYVTFGLFGASVLLVVLHGGYEFSQGNVPLLTLFDGSIPSRLVWLGVLGDILGLYFLSNNSSSKLNTSTDDAYTYFDVYTRSFLAQMLKSAGKNKSCVTPSLLVWGLVRTGYMNMVFKRLELVSDSIAKGLDTAYPLQFSPLGSTSMAFDAETEQYLLAAIKAAQARGTKECTVVDILLVMLEKIKPLREFFEKIEVGPERLTGVLSWLSEQDQIVNQYRDLRTSRLHTGATNRAWTSKPAPLLDHFGHDLTISASYGAVPFISVREKEVEQAIRALSRSTKNSLMLVGEPGAGKSSIVDRIALRMVTQDVPLPMQDKRLVQLDTAALHASKSGFEATFEELISEAEAAGNVILFIPNLADLTQGTAEGVPSAELLLPILDRARMQIIGATSNREYREEIERNATITQAFEVVTLEPLSEKQAIAVLEEKAGDFEARNHVQISLKAIEAAVHLSEQYIHDQVLPEKAIDVLDEAVVLVSQNKKQVVSEDDIRTIITQRTKVPVATLDQSEQKLLLNLEEELHGRVIGQEEAVKAVSEALRRARAGLQDTNRPIGTFLFVGPTGVGKTELAKALAGTYFKDEQAMIRLDMSEFQDTTAISRLIGEGNKEGLLTGPVRNRPFALVLLDEFEKAAQEIRNLFLQVIDDGRITDGAGHVVDFKNSILIATSNAGSLDIQTAVQAGQDYATIKNHLMEQVLPKIYTPELLNRFDGIIVFKALVEADILQIARLEVAHVVKRLRDNSGIEAEVADDAVSALAHLGFDPVFGARPLRRVIQEKLEGPLAQKVLAGGLKRGDHVTITQADLAA